MKALFWVRGHSVSFLEAQRVEEGQNPCHRLGGECYERGISEERRRREEWEEEEEGGGGERRKEGGGGRRRYICIPV